MLSASIILSEYIKILTASDIADEDLGVQIAFPRFCEELTVKLLDETLTYLKDLSLIYKLKSDLYIVGDIHGNIRDLIRILRQINFLDTGVRILFLGDYVDRGDFSIEVITFLFSLVVQFPDRIFLLRGNHEFSSVNIKYGFKEQIASAFGNEELWIQFNTVFNWLPIAAIIDDRIFCIHGGISPHLKNISQIDALERPIVSFHDNNLLADLMWSDPSSNVPYYLQSERGFGCIFGADAIIDFCRSQNIEKIIRAHQCVDTGIENILHGKVITVFSCSNYCDTCQNLAGYLYINKDALIPTVIQPLSILKRDDALFKDSLKRGSSEIYDSSENVSFSNINLMNSGFNTGIKNPSHKLCSIRRKSSFSQTFTRPLPIPLSALHMMPSEQVFLKQSSNVTQSSQNFNLSDNNEPRKLTKNSKIINSQIFNTKMLQNNDSIPITHSYMPSLKQTVLPSLPTIPENQQEKPIDLQNTHLLSLYQNK